MHCIVYTFIRFVSSSAKFGICTVVGLNGTLVDAKIRTFKCLKCVILPFRPTTVQMSNLALIETKGIIVQCAIILESLLLLLMLLLGILQKT
jgi:hypothetical protein